MLKIILADPDPAVRAAFRILMKRKVPDSQLGEAADWTQLMQELEMHMPDLLLIDWYLPGKPNESGMRDWIRSEARFLVVGMSINANDRSSILEDGVQAFLYKGENPESVIQELENLLKKKLD
jgi:DNA-binding NarL/FixJ family response regulator